MPPAPYRWAWRWWMPSRKQMTDDFTYTILKKHKIRKYLPHPTDHCFPSSSPGTCERRPEPRWTCAWASTPAPCWEECSARRGGSSTSGPQTSPWPIRWSLGGFLGERAILFSFRFRVSEQLLCAFYVKRSVCYAGECTFPRPPGTACTESLSWSPARAERGASTCRKKASTRTWF